MKSLPVNLATQPIEGLTRARRWVIVAAIVAGALTLVQLTFVVQIAADTARPPVVETLDDLPLESWEEQVHLYETLVRETSPREIGAAADLARELISWRAFPWGEVFGDLEGALPQDVRLVRVQPGRDTEGGFSVELTAESRRPTSLNEFFRAVEGLDTVNAVLPVMHEPLDDGRVHMTIELRYRPSGAADVGTADP